MFDVREYWDFSDPKGSRDRFLALLETETDPAIRHEIIAQVARTHGLEKNFDQGFATLDQVQPVGRAVACFELERGRLYRSSGNKEKAKPHFESANNSSEDDIKVDALHMLAIIASPAESEKLNLEALGIAARSTNPLAQRWQGSLLNNLGWTYFDTHRFPEALNTFKRALKAREEEGKPQNIHVAHWCVARCYRELRMHEDALTILTSLLENEDDEYVFEELAENYRAIGQLDQANKYQAKLDEIRPKPQS